MAHATPPTTVLAAEMRLEDKVNRETWNMIINDIFLIGRGWKTMTIRDFMNSLRHLPDQVHQRQDTTTNQPLILIGFDAMKSKTIFAHNKGPLYFRTHAPTTGLFALHEYIGTFIEPFCWLSDSVLRSAQSNKPGRIEGGVLALVQLCQLGWAAKTGYKERVLQRPDQAALADILRELVQTDQYTALLGESLPHPSPELASESADLDDSSDEDAAEPTRSRRSRKRLKRNEPTLHGPSALSTSVHGTARGRQDQEGPTEPSLTFAQRRQKAKESVDKLKARVNKGKVNRFSAMPDLSEMVIEREKTEKDAAIIRVWIATWKKSAPTYEFRKRHYPRADTELWGILRPSTGNEQYSAKFEIMNTTVLDENGQWEWELGPVPDPAKDLKDKSMQGDLVIHPIFEKVRNNMPFLASIGRCYFLLAAAAGHLEFTDHGILVNDNLVADVTKYCDLYASAGIDISNVQRPFRANANSGQKDQVSTNEGQESDFSGDYEQRFLRETMTLQPRASGLRDRSAVPAIIDKVPGTTRRTTRPQNRQRNQKAAQTTPEPAQAFTSDDEDITEQDATMRDDNADATVDPQSSFTPEGSPNHAIDNTTPVDVPMQDFAENGIVLANNEMDTPVAGAAQDRISPEPPHEEARQPASDFDREFFGTMGRIMTGYSQMDRSHNTISELRKILGDAENLVNRR